MELLELDYTLFYTINHTWQHPFLDAILPFWRNKYIWAPLYLFILTYLVINHKRKGLWIVLCLGLTVTISDVVSSRVVKPLVHRVRPCNNADLTPPARQLVRCGSGYSFTSSHATNHFGVAVFLIILFARKHPWIRWVLFFWAGTISLGQVYVGVHYPFDIVGGALLGSAIGILTAEFCRRNVQLEFLE